MRSRFFIRKKKINDINFRIKILNKKIGYKQKEKYKKNNFFEKLFCKESKKK